MSQSENDSHLVAAFPSADRRNIIEAQCSWEALCFMSISFANSEDYDAFRNELANVEVDETTVDSTDKALKGFKGYLEKGTAHFLREASSGASIEATCQEDGSYALVFQGCDTSGGAESALILDFALAADLETVKATGRLSDGPAIVGTIKVFLFHLYIGQRTYSASKLRRFAEKLELSLE